MSQEIEYGLHSVKNFRLLNFATGTYYCKCFKCDRQFIGAKQSSWCLQCSIKVAEESSNNLQQLGAEIRAISDIITEYGESDIAVDFAMLKRRLRQLSSD